MPCEFKLKGYCFHPERASGDVLAMNCAYGWLNKIIEKSAESKIIGLENEEQ